MGGKVSKAGPSEKVSPGSCLRRHAQWQIMEQEKQELARRRERERVGEREREREG